ncbi:ruvB-like helicase 1 [Colletotrichum tofieldiae]|nr:ruvB-like helicase 1 [Colletotrichum tofieldiae]
MPDLVLRTYINRNGPERRRKNLEIRDKLATWRGVKFTVGSMIPFQQVQQLENTETDERFRPDIIVSTKNLTRGMRGKLREMSVCISMFKNMLSFRLGSLKDDVKTTISHNRNIKSTVKLPSAYLLSNGHRIVIKENSETTMVIKCSYVIARVMNLR